MVQEVLQRRWEPWRWGAQWPAIWNWQPTESIIEADPLRTWEVAKWLNIDHFTVIWNLKQTGKVKKFNKWVLVSWPQIKKIIVLKYHLLSFCTTMKHFLMGLWSLMRSGLYTTTGNCQLSGWTKMTLQSTSQSRSCTKKRSRSLFGGPLPVWSTTAFWTPVKPLYLRHMLKKLIRYTQNCNACSCYWSTERAQFFSMTTHGCRYTTNTSKVETTGLQSFASSTIFTWPPANYHFFKHLNTFLQEKSFPNL